MFEGLFHPPAAEHLPLIGPLTALLLLAHLPWLGMLLVSSGLSLALRKSDPPLSGRLLDLAAAGPAAWWIFGVLSPLGLLFLSGQFFYGTPLFMPARFAAVILILFPAYILLYLYRRTGRSPAGGAGHLLLFAAAYILVSVMVLGTVPERFAFEREFLPWLFSIEQVVHFFLFTALSVLLTGAALLFFTFRWKESGPEPDAVRSGRLRNLGAGLVLGAGLSIPVLIIGELYNLEPPAMSAPVFLTALVAAALAWPASQLAYAMIAGGHARHAAAVFVLGIALFAVYSTHVVLLQSRASQERLAALLADARAAHQKEVSARGALMAKSLKPDAKIGEGIFASKCSACHAFDHKVVGPAYDDVLPKYANDPDALRAFIRSPVKKDPAFPPMPAQGLTEMEVQSVALFLLDHEKGK